MTTNKFQVKREDIEKASKKILEGASSERIKTGFADLDNLIGGFRKGELIVLGARPAMGKTSLALCIVRNTAVIDRIPTMVFSLEMSRQRLLERLIKLISCMEISNLEKLDDQQKSKIMDAAKQLEKTPLFINDIAGISAGQIKEDVFSCTEFPKLIIIDYLQLIAGRENCYLKKDIRGIMNNLKNIAKETGCPILVLSQLERKVEFRQNHMPVLSDLRGSGYIEEVADKVILLHRDEYYNSDSFIRGIAQLIVAKNREGCLGTTELAFIPEKTAFFTLRR